MSHRPPNALAAAIERVDSMPALTESRDRLLDALADEKGTQTDLVAAVESDVGLVVAVMRRANAQPGGKIATVGDAIRILGPDGVEILARGIATYDFFEHLPGWNLPPERFRLHAVGVAGMVDLIARELEHPRIDELLVAATLHDIGKVVMTEAYPDYGQQIAEDQDSPDERARAERLHHGVDHSVIGGVMLRRWRLPKVIAQAVERHHAPDARADAAIVRLADMLAHYERGDAVRPGELEQAATQLKIGGARLRALMYSLQNRGKPRKRARAPSPLTGKEREVLRGLAASKVYKEIAHDLGVSASTVRSHLHNVYPKLGAVDRAQAVLVATREGWI